MEVLKAIQNQTCRDFELVIVDNGSDDQSVRLIEREISNFQDIRVIFQKHAKTENEITGWNRPLSCARGQFIAICEGDDYFSPNHLQEAKNVLQSNQNIGIYVAGFNLTKFNPSLKLSGYEEKLNELKLFKWCPPPSTAIFRRLSRNQNPYFFDESFVWAGEMSLYYKILVERFIVVENLSENFVQRGFNHYIKTSFHMKDMIKVRHGDWFEYSNNEKRFADSMIAKRALSLLIYQVIFARLETKLINIFLKYFSSGNKDLRSLLKVAKTSLVSAMKLRIYLIRRR